MFGRPRRLTLLAEGRFTPADAKTAVSVPWDGPKEVAAVIDSTRPGRTVTECAGAPRKTGPTATDRVRFGAGAHAGPFAAFRRDHAPAA
jgi:hypothetical protein